MLTACSEICVAGLADPLMFILNTFCRINFQGRELYLAVFDPYKYDMDVCTELCSSGQPASRSSHSKTFTLDITRKFFNHIISYVPYALLVYTILYHFR